MSHREELSIRDRLQLLFDQLRAAAAAALNRHAVVATRLDESRSELERLLMLESIDERDAMRALTRAQLMLDAWRGIAGSVVPVRSR